MSTTYEVIHDATNGPVKKRFGDLDKAREYAQDKVFAGGPARINVFEEDETPGPTSKRRTKPEPEFDEPPRRKPKPKPEPPRRKA